MSWDSFSTAKTICQNMGAKVITFKSYGKFIDFRNIYIWKFFSSPYYFWVGAVATNPKEFYWYDDNSTVESWIWADKEPNNALSNELCAIGRHNPLVITDDICNTGVNTICEYSD